MLQRLSVFVLLSVAFLTARSACAAEVVFVKNNSVFAVETVGSAPRKVAQGTSAALNPTGKWLAYTSEDSQNGVRLLHLVTGEKRVLTDIKGRIRGLRFSPKGDKLCFVLYNGSKNELRYCSTTGISKVKSVKVAEEGQYGFGPFEPTWAPDGTLVFHDINNLYRVRLDGTLVEKIATGKIAGEANQVSSADRFDYCPTNPKLIAFTKAVPRTPKYADKFSDPGIGLFTYDFSTGDRKRVTKPGMIAFAPCWSPNGKFLVFTGYPESDYKLAYPFKVYRVAPDGTGLTKIGVGEEPRL
jgi:Tol biopolymer transport system component